MALKEEKVEIDGYTYNITQLGAVEGSRIVIRVSKALAPMLDGLAKHESLTEQSVMSALGTGIEHLDEALVQELCDTFAKRTLLHFNEKWVELPKFFDQHFAGRYVAMTRWLLAHFNLNFVDFLGGGGLGNVLSTIRKKAGSQSPSSTNTSGESS